MMQVRPFIHRTEAHVLTDYDHVEARAVVTFATTLLLLRVHPQKELLLKGLDELSETASAVGLGTLVSDEALALRQQLFEQCRQSLLGGR